MVSLISCFLTASCSAGVERWERPRQAASRPARDQPGRLAQGPEEKKDRRGFLGGFDNEPIRLLHKKRLPIVSNKDAPAHTVGARPIIQRFASATSVLASTRAPAARSWGVAFSASLWLMPRQHGMNIIPAGEISAM